MRVPPIDRPRSATFTGPRRLWFLLTVTSAEAHPEHGHYQAFQLISARMIRFLDTFTLTDIAFDALVTLITGGLENGLEIDPHRALWGCTPLIQNELPLSDEKLIELIEETVG